MLGSSDEAGGCQGCTLLPGANGTWILRLRLPEAMVKRHGKYLYLTDVRFNYRSELLQQADAKSAVRREQADAYKRLVKAEDVPLDEDGKAITENAFLAPYGQSLSYRFLRDKKGWRVLVSTSAEFRVAKPDFRTGALGVDFNAGFVSIADVNQRG